ncbi:MAG: hypothetical protein RLZZ440_683 [Planctomycetota bacterium]
MTVDGKRTNRGPIVADERVLLEDLRLRGDREPFQAVAEATKGGG